VQTGAEPAAETSCVTVKPRRMYFVQHVIYFYNNSFTCLVRRVTFASSLIDVSQR
jgi:hypothetical protein